MKTPKLTFCILYVLIMSAQFNFAQNPASLMGYVSNSETSEPVDGAMVMLGDYNALTGPDGYYFIGDITSGTYDLYCTGGGFCTYYTSLYLGPGQNLTLDIALKYALLEVFPDTVEISLYPNSSGYVYFELINPGTCDHTYYAVGDVVWLSIPNTTTGSVGPFSVEELAWITSSYNLEPGLHEGNIIIYSFDNSSPDSVHVMLEVLGYTPPGNLTGFVECTDICLHWEVPATGSPLYYKIYRDGNLVTNFTGIEYCDQYLEPGTDHCYRVTAVYVSGESEPTDEYCTSVALPENIEPQNAHCTHYYNANWIFWDEAEGCLEPDGYNVYRDGELLTTQPIPDLVYTDLIAEPNIFEYEVSAVYFFGESELVLADCLTGVDEKENQTIAIYPNPARGWIIIRSPGNMAQIDIYDNLGKKVYFGSDAKRESTINLAGNKPGIYFIRVETNEGVFTRRMVIQ